MLQADLGTKLDSWTDLLHLQLLITCSKQEQRKKRWRRPGLGNLIMWFAARLTWRGFS